MILKLWELVEANQFLPHNTLLWVLVLNTIIITMVSSATKNSVEANRGLALPPGIRQTNPNLESQHSHNQNQTLETSSSDDKNTQHPNNWLYLDEDHVTWTVKVVTVTSPALTVTLLQQLCKTKTSTSTTPNQSLTKSCNPTLCLEEPRGSSPPGGREIHLK